MAESEILRIFMIRIMVFKEKEKESDVDEREKARYGPSVKREEAVQQYDRMMDICRNAISQAEEIIFFYTISLSL